MIDLWQGLSLTQQIFALIAIPSTLILILQTILLLIGIGNDSDVDADADTDIDVEGADITIDDGLSLFTVRGILSMLCIAGWVGVGLLETAMPEWLAVLIAVVCGLATLVLIAYLMKAMNKLQSNGNIDVGNCVGKIAEVYIPIPPAGSGSGKVTLTVQEKFSEFTAITTSKTILKARCSVRVVSVDENGTLLVEPLITSDNEE